MAAPVMATTTQRRAIITAQHRAITAPRRAAATTARDPYGPTTLSAVAPAHASAPAAAWASARSAKELANSASADLKQKPGHVRPGFCAMALGPFQSRGLRGWPPFPRTIVP